MNHLAVFLVALLGAAACNNSAAQPSAADPPAAPAAPAPASTDDEALAPVTFPDVALFDQRGAPVRIRDLVHDKIVVMNFVYTSCSSICPTLGVAFEQLQALEQARLGREVRLISVTIDPENDTPERLREWGARYHAGPGWTLLGGAPRDVEQLLKALSVYTAVKESHVPIVLAGNDRTGTWRRAHGLTTPAKLHALVDELSAAPPAAAEPSAAQRYFGDAALVDQDGTPRRFYSDLIRDRIVIIDTFFAHCTGICPVLTGTFARIQDHLGDRLGRDVVMLSISVDPQRDTPDKLKEYAQRFQARPGWYFLAGDRAEVEPTLRRLGLWVDDPNDHKALVLVGNDRTGLWKKALGMATPEAVIQVVDSVIADRGEDAAAR
ncbi:MAG TPA: SCO family protein [Kofleriaceae bacterium]|nr:SCO family protein [Kofleriaceae bacterium]